MSASSGTFTVLTFSVRRAEFDSRRAGVDPKHTLYIQSKGFVGRRRLALSSSSTSAENWARRARLGLGRDQMFCVHEPAVLRPMDPHETADISDQMTSPPPDPQQQGEHTVCCLHEEDQMSAHHRFARGLTGSWHEARHQIKSKYLPGVCAVQPYVSTRRLQEGKGFFHS